LRRAETFDILTDSDKQPRAVQTMLTGKRYQVFVSSTFSDLKKERANVLKILMSIDCIPAGMEIFTAFDEEQLSFIKKVIDDCDYYLLIIAGRYGSIDKAGVSFTEREYDYAVKKNIPILAFIKRDIDDIIVAKTDKDPDRLEKLKSFRDKVAKGRLVELWDEAAELPAKVTVSLVQTMKMQPAIGWIRADRQANDEILGEINELRKENDSLKQELSEQTKKPLIEDLASMDSEFKFTLNYKKRNQYETVERSIDIPMSWKNLFGLIGPDLLEPLVDSGVNMRIQS